MAETFRVLRRMDASSVQLDVASTNRVALDLYDRWGFRRAEQEDVLRIALPGRAQAVVRRADKGDLAAILDIYAEDELSTSPEPTDLAAIADAFDAITNDPKAFLYVATLEDRVVGTFQMNVLRHLTHGGGHVAQIESVAVSRSCRGQGIGTEMMRFALAEARRLGCIRAQLTSQKRRARAHTFYEALGFERTHEDEAQVVGTGNPNSRRACAIAELPGASGSLPRRRRRRSWLRSDTHRVCRRCRSS